jgi:hypothetical protein
MIKNCEHVIAWDIQDEYGLSYDMRASPKRFALSPRNSSLKAFFNLISSCEGYTFVLEEATGYFRNGKLPEEFVKEILSKRHSHNNFILVFHMLNSIPPELWGFTDVVILFKTEDLERNVKNKYPQIYPEWQRLQTSTTKHPTPTGGNWTINDHYVLNKTNLSKKK